MIQLDHLVLPVPDLDGAARSLTRAGFVVTPTAPHPFGTANRLVVFESCYLELVAVIDPAAVPATGFARTVADHLEGGQPGFSHIACGACSVTDAGDTVRRAGFEAGEPSWFSRPAPRSDGSEIVASFTILPIVGHPRQFFCVHHTPDAIWFRPHLQHENGARDVTGVSAASPPAIPVAGVTAGADRIALDETLDPIEISGVLLG